MVIKEVVETIEFYRKTSIALFKNTDLLQDLDCKLNIYKYQNIIYYIDNILLF